MDTRPDPVDFRIDREGRWFANGQEVIHEKIFRLFCDSLIKEDDGYKIRIDNMENPVSVDDAPFSVRNIYLENTADGEDVIQMALSDGRILPLAPETLRSPAPDAVYAEIIDGRGLKARFSPVAMTGLSNFIECDDSGAYYILLNDNKYFLK